MEIRATKRITYVLGINGRTNKTQTQVFTLFLIPKYLILKKIEKSLFKNIIYSRYYTFSLWITKHQN